MKPISSISAALANVNLSTTLESLHSTPFDFSYLSASTLATIAAIFGASYFVLYGLLEINKPKGFRQIPSIPSLIATIGLFKRMPFVERYRFEMRAVQEK